MKRIILTFGLVLTGLALFGQSPRIRLNQITKDSLTGSVVLSGSDSNMVYSRDFFLNLTDSVLILFGDTLSTTATAFSGVTTDLTLTGNGTVGNELKVDTAIIATVSALADSLAGIISSVTTDLTLTGDGSVATPLKVDTSVIATIRALADSVATRGTVTSVAVAAGTGISVSGSPITTSGTITVTNSAPDQTVSITGGGINAVTGTYPNFTITGTEVDGSTTNELQTISTTGAAGNISLSNGGGTLNLNVNDADASATNEGSLTVGAGGANSSDIVSNTSGSTNVTIAGGTGINVTEAGSTITIAATGGGGSFTNLTETADTVFVAKYLNVDTATLYVDAATNRVGIGTASSSATLDVISGSGKMAFNGTRLLLYDSSSFADKQNIFIGDQSGNANAKDLNVAIGYKAGNRLSSTARANVFLGGLAGSNDTITGRFNLGIGYNSLYDLTSGISNVGIGIGAVDDVTTGSDNIGIGFIAGRNLTTGSNNIYIGASALPSSATVTNEIVIGSSITGNGSNTVTLGNSSITKTILNGNVGIGTTAPGSRLHTKSSAANDALLVEDDSGACEAQPTTTGLTWSCSSDQRLKTDIQVPASVLNYVKNIPLKDYTVIKTAERVMGPIAQELLETYPELVTTGEDGYYRVSSLGSWTLVKAIQEQQSIIESQQQEIETLKTQIQNILTEINNLKNN